MTIECYAQRLLNPFRGAVNTIKYAAAEAVTLDGVDWDIYIANDQLLEGLRVNRWTQISDVRYGNWSAETGLKRGPLYPSEDFRRMEEMGAVVFEHLTRLYQHVPFAFKDNYELWLLDEESQPLALLHSVIEKEDIELDFALKWRAGFAARERFSSPAMEALGSSLNESMAAADYLTQCINGRAGKMPAAQWFYRNKVGRGLGLQGIDMAKALEGRTLDHEAFPLLLLSDAGQDDMHRQLIEDFLAWQSPCLLVLPNLDSATRRGLEHSAHAQALAVHKHYRLYPQTIDESMINATLVEAMLRLSEPMEKGTKSDTLSTFYIELLNPGPTG